MPLHSPSGVPGRLTGERETCAKAIAAVGVTPDYLIGQGENLVGLSPELRKLLAKDGALPGGLIALAQHTELMNALQITESIWTATCSC